MTNLTIDKWKSEAYALEEPLDQLPLPLPLLVDEAADVGWFCELHWDPEVGADGIEIHPGLCAVGNPSVFDRRIGRELLELQDALQAAQTEYRWIAQGGEDNDMDRGHFLLSELDAALCFLSYEDPEALDVERLDVLKLLYEDAATHADLASALQNFGSFSALQRAALHELGGFDVGLIPEALSLAGVLRRRARERGPVLAQDLRAALRFRNRIATLVWNRLQRARVVIQFAFRHHPDLIQRAVGSRYRPFRSNNSMIRGLGGFNIEDDASELAM